MIVQEDGTLDADDVAKILKLNARTVKRLAARGKLPGFQIAGKWRFRREAIEEHMRRLERQAGEQRNSE